LLDGILAIQDQTPDDASWWRRTLSLGLLLQGVYQKLRRAQEVLHLTDRISVDGVSREELRVKVMVLTPSRAQDNRHNAITLLQEMGDRQTLAPDDQFLLAQLHEMGGDWPQARQQMLVLVSSQSDNPQYPLFLARYIRGLLRNKQLN